MVSVKKSVKENVTKSKVLVCRGWPLLQATRPAFFRRLHLDKRQILLAAALTALVAAPAVSTAADREKCFGVAKAGRNDCASLNGTHSCAGQATRDNSPVDWKNVAKGTCKQSGGMLADEARKAEEAKRKNK